MKKPNEIKALVKILKVILSCETLDHLQLVEDWIKKLAISDEAKTRSMIYVNKVIKTRNQPTLH